MQSRVKELEYNKEKQSTRKKKRIEENETDVKNKDNVGKKWKRTKVKEEMKIIRRGKEKNNNKKKQRKKKKKE